MPVTGCFWAHSENSQGNKHRLKDHLESVAIQARKFAEIAIPSDSQFIDAAYWAGLLHDFGKYSDLFQRRLVDPSIRGVDHWSSGALSLANAKQLLSAYAVYGHHLGIPNSTEIINLIKCGNSNLPETMEELKKRQIDDGFSPSITNGKPLIGPPIVFERGRNISRSHEEAPPNRQRR